LVVAIFLITEAPSQRYGGASFELKTQKGIMRTAKRPRTKLLPTTDKYRPEDLEAMRQAFICACHEYPDLSATEAQRYDFADAMVSVYRKHITQQELVTGSVGKMKEMNAKPRDTNKDA
jgi:hypothetical protein